MSEQYFAQLDADNVVTDIKVVTQQFLDANPQRYLGRFVETFINTPGKTYAAKGYIYNEDTQDFTQPPAIEP